MGVEWSVERIEKVYGCTFCKKLMGLPNCAATGFAENELGRAGERSS
jgi:hypothetical protein